MEKSGKVHRHLPAWESEAEFSGSMSISSDGEYVVVGQKTEVFGLKLETTNPLKYKPFMTLTGDSFYVGENVMSFSAAGDRVAIGYVGFAVSATPHQRLMLLDTKSWPPRRRSSAS